MNKIIVDTKINRELQRPIILVGGCFDVLHPAHLIFLKKSKKLGGSLVVLLESDENIRQLKGKGRPLNNQNTRAENLSNIEDVDKVILLKTPQSSIYYYNLVKSIQPDIIAVTGGDPLLEIKEEQAKMVSGKVVEVMERDANHSSTSLINKKK